MKTTNKLYLIATILVSLAFSSCKSEDPVPENDGELITDVTLHFQEFDENLDPVGDLISFQASDPEGIENGQSPTIDIVTLKKGKNYIMTIDVANSIANEDITGEILEESDEHQFYFLGSAWEGDSAPLTYAYDDPSGELIGIQGIVTVEELTSINNSQMRIVLRHDLDKNYPGADNPNFVDFTAAGGESDLDITFPLVIE
ncbi:hypothetical protein [Algoriphagus chordae]|uniref:Type 1 periplasmic binding fold superfamily protein n=1 Tax=Algoriphagus chordae TaxID=237019 RepID=A0A2W7QNT3_9BACT|nr:hypothetical protein [Algoriphagus chordae]PZX49641.1 hypothetical protein LV85_03084 [Algoriphagus chordae]